MLNEQREQEGERERKGTRSMSSSQSAELVSKQVTDKLNYR